MGHNLKILRGLSVVVGERVNNASFNFSRVKRVNYVSMQVFVGNLNFSVGSV